MKIELAIFADKDYDRFKGSVTCEDKRIAATLLRTIMVPTDGTWSIDYPHVDN